MGFPFEVEKEEGILDIFEYEIPREYEIDFVTGQLTGNIVEGLEAIRTWIWLALHTERYRHVIFSWEYGNELETLIGKTYSQEYIDTEVPEMIKDCLCMNRFIHNVSDVDFEIRNDKLVGTFVAQTDYGEVRVSV